MREALLTRSSFSVRLDPIVKRDVSGYYLWLWRFLNEAINSAFLTCDWTVLVNCCWAMNINILHLSIDMLLYVRLYMNKMSGTLERPIQSTQVAGNLSHDMQSHCVSWQLNGKNAIMTSLFKSHLISLPMRNRLNHRLGKSLFITECLGGINMWWRGRSNSGSRTFIRLSNYLMQ